MRRKLHKILPFVTLSLFSFNAFAQGEPATFVEKNLPDNSQGGVAAPAATAPAPGSSETPATDKKTAEKPAGGAKVNDALEMLLLNKKATSLMFDDEQNNNIDRAVESLKNNQTFIPEGEEDPTVAAEKKEDAAKLEEKRIEENEKSYLYLASIIYYSGADWAVWINDQKITSKTNDRSKELYLKSVQRTNVKVVWKLSISKWKILSGRKSEEVAPKINKDNQVEVEFDLRPNQTFILSTNSVVEGRAVIALLKKRAEERKVKESKESNAVKSENSATPAAAPKNVKAGTTGF